MLRRYSRIALGVAFIGSFGCAGTYDLVTSQRFRERPMHTLFGSDDPMYVLENVEEGDDRVRAMRELKEPKKNGGSDADQDKAINILQVSATSDKRPFIRLAAIEALSRFEDPRAGSILITAYQNALNEAPTKPSDLMQVGGIRQSGNGFTPESITFLQCRVMESLAKHKQPASLSLLINVASTPVEQKKPVEPAGGVLKLEGSIATNENDRVDVRLAAIRALGNYEKNMQAAQALVSIMQTEKDVAVIGRTHEALVKVTGQDLPAEASVWVEWLGRNRR